MTPAARQEILTHEADAAELRAVPVGNKARSASPETSGEICWSTTALKDDCGNPHLREFRGYGTARPLAEIARELGLNQNKIVRLAGNENPLGPSPKALSAMQAALSDSHLYPDSSGFDLRAALAEKLRLTRDNLILGNGSNELLEFLGHAFLAPGVDLVISEHAFIAYKVIAGLFGARAIEVRSPDLRHDLDAMAEAITPETRLIFIATPNNPTGTLVTQNEIDRFMDRVPPNVVVAFDEAYFDYVDDPPDVLRFVRNGRKVFVLRTFSKFHGLAGLRIGYGIAQPGLIQILEKTRQPFHVNTIALTGALAALADVEHGRQTKRVTDEGREFLQNEFRALGLEIIPSAANFVLARVGDGAGVSDKLLRQHILVASLKGYDLAEWIRVSVGTADQNEQCVVALREILCADPESRA